ncbi:MAG: Ig-like domain-containing protein, partial [Prevotellaceae bacterium]|nr:Ig-like domain-containing protein [Prevotellaceae bacterium]
MKKYILYLIAVSCILLAGGKLYSQTTQGTDFWIAFGKNLDRSMSQLTFQIKIVTTNAAEVRLTFSSLSSSNRTINISPGTTYTIPLTEAERNAVYSTGSAWAYKSLHITSNNPVSVYALNAAQFTSDATNILPTNVLGTDYYHISYTGYTGYVGDPPSWIDYRDAITIVATATGRVTCTSSTGSIYRDLSAGATWYITANENTDLTGWHVTSDKPVAYFVTHQGAMIPNSTKSNQDNLFQQLAPTTSWGTNFFVPDIGIAAQYPLLVRVMASQDGTVITQQGGTVTSGSLSLNKGEFVTMSISNTGCFISSNEPVGVCSYLLSYSTPLVTNNGGPAMVWIPPVEQRVASTTVSSFSTYANTIYAVIVTPTSTRGNTTVKIGNGATSSLSGSWTERNGYSYTRYQMTSDAPHTFSNPAGLTVLVFGLGASESYYYLGGSSMYNLEMMFTVNGINYQDISGDTICTRSVALKATLQHAKTTEPGYLQWYIDGNLEASATDQLEWNTTLSPGAHTIKMDVLDLSGDRKWVSTDIVIGSSDVSITGNLFVCKMSQQQLTGIPANGEWKSLNPEVATVNSAGVVSGLTAGTATVRYIFTGTSGCVDSSEVEMVVYDLPSAPTANDSTACYDGEAHTGSATADTDEIIVWYKEATGTETASAPSRTEPGATKAYAAAKNTLTNCESSTRTAVTVTVYELPAVVDLRSTDDSNILCSGNNLVLYVNNTNDYSSDVTYVWYDGSEEQAQGVGMYTYSVTSAGDYSVRVYDAYGCSVTSDTLTITQSTTNITTPVIESESGSTEICGAESGVMLNLVTSYTGNVSYQWYDTAIITGATSSHYYATNPNDYKVVVTIDDCSAESNVISLTMNPTGTTAKPVLKSQGDLTELCDGTGSLLLYADNASAYTSAATYVWYENDSDSVVLSGTGLYSYIVTAAGSYSVYVYEADGCGSGSDTLRITQGTTPGITVPVIESESGSTVICGTESGVMLNLVTSYTGNVSYQWYDTAIITGATSSHYYATAKGDYRVLVTVDNCSAQSNVISVTLNSTGTTAKPVLRSQGDLTELCDGSSSLLLYADNTSDYTSTATYVWYENDSDSVVLSGTGLYSYIVTSVGSYSVYVYEADGCGAGSDTLTITPGTTPGITVPVIESESGSTEICGAESGVMLNLVTSYTGNVSYQWYDTVIIPGATSSHYYATNPGDYRVLVTVDNCSAQSNVITVTLNPTGTTAKPVLRSQGDLTELCDGSSSLLLYADNATDYTSSATYVWYENDSDSVVLSGTGLYSYIVTTAGSYSVYVYEADGCGSGSDTLTITQGTTPGITVPVIESESGSTEICGASSGVMLNIITSYTGNVSYQWYDTVIIPGATSSHYYATNPGDYRVIVTVDNCSAQSNVISVTFNWTGTTAKPVLRSQGDLTELCDGSSSLLLYVENTNAYTSTATYVWYEHDNDEIVQNGIGLYSYIVTAAGSYRVYVYEADGCGSGSDTLTITPGTTPGITVPVIESESGSTEICGSESGVMLNMITSYTGNVSYQWYDTVVIPGATSSHYYATAQGDYRVIVTVDNCSAQSNVISVTFNSTGTTVKPVLKSQGDLTELCDGTGSLLLYVDNISAYTSTATYVWYENDSDSVVLSGTGLYSYIATTAGSYSVYVYEADGCGSGSDTLTITQGTTPGITVPVIESESGSTEICGSESGVMLNLITSYTGNVSYQWYDTAIITGATSSHYYATNPGDYKVLVTVDNCSAQSNVISVTLNPTGTTAKPVLRSQGDLTELCDGSSSLLLYVENTSAYTSSATYVWYEKDS